MNYKLILFEKVNDISKNLRQEGRQLDRQINGNNIIIKILYNCKFLTVL